MISRSSTMLVAVLLSAAATAQQPAGSATAAATAGGAPAAEKRICRSIIPTGSIMRKRFCLTREDWRTFNNIAAQSADSFLSKRVGGMCDGSSGQQCSPGGL